jgi:hypothetical protein
MVVASLSLGEDYWTNFELQEEDIEFLYNLLLEREMPLTTNELTTALVEERVRREKIKIEQQRSSKGELYLPKETYQIDQNLVFPAVNWKAGRVTEKRPGRNPDLGEFEVLKVKFEDGVEKEYASELSEHALNVADISFLGDETLEPGEVMGEYGELLEERLETEMEDDQNFVRIAGKWFARALLVDVNTGHLNLAEAVLDMAGGGPLPTSNLLEQIELDAEVNPKLVEFSLDLSLQEDERFDEVGAAGEVVWFLKRLEPQEVHEPPIFLRYSEIEHDRSILSKEMLDLERELDDELSPLGGKFDSSEVEVRLIFPHWRAGTLPLASRIRHLFPTAYEAPRIRFILIDGDTGKRFPGWVVRSKRYVFGLREWYEEKNLMPGSLVWVRKGKNLGEVIVRSDNRKPGREWIRTLLVGSDGGIVFAMLKQLVSAAYDERMAIAVPDMNAVDQVWTKMQKEKLPFERVVVNTVRELAKLNPQSHVHTSELYAAVNILRRCPPAPILALLASRPWFVHVGDLHFRFDDSEMS